LHFFDPLLVYLHYKLNIHAVKIKSRPNTANEAVTTVRVVARETPSGVGDAM
jgi:hypothetical protein